MNATDYKQSEYIAIYKKTYRKYKNIVELPKHKKQ